MKKFLLASIAVALSTSAHANKIKPNVNAIGLLTAQQTEAMKQGCVTDVKGGLQAEAEALGITNAHLLDFDLKSTKPLIKGGSAPAEAAKECMAQVKAAYTKGEAPTSQFVNLANPTYATTKSKFNWSGASAAGNASAAEGTVDESGLCVCPRIAPVSAVVPTASSTRPTAAVAPVAKPAIASQPAAQVAQQPAAVVQPVAAAVAASPAPAAAAPDVIEMRWNDDIGDEAPFNVTKGVWA